MRQSSSLRRKLLTITILGSLLTAMIAAAAFTYWDLKRFWAQTGDEVTALASVVGEEGLSEIDRRYVAFGETFERKLVHQAGARSLEQSMALGWQLLAELPRSELSRLSDAQIEAHVGPAATAPGST